MSECFIPPYTPLLNAYSKTGFYRGMHYFLIFALKHRLWVLTEAVLTCTHNQCKKNKTNKKNYIFLKIIITERVPTINVYPQSM